MSKVETNQLVKDIVFEDILDRLDVEIIEEAKFDEDICRRVMATRSKLIATRSKMGYSTPLNIEEIAIPSSRPHEKFFHKLPSIDKLHPRIRAHERNYDASLFCKGLDLGHFGMYNEALNCFEKVIQLDPSYDRAWSYKGLCLTCLERFKEALNCYDKVIELNPNDDDAKDSKARILAMLEEQRKSSGKQQH